MLLLLVLLFDGYILGCSVSTGQWCIAAIVFWFVASCMTCAHGKERMDARKDDRNDWSFQEAKRPVSTLKRISSYPIVNRIGLENERFPRKPIGFVKLLEGDEGLWELQTQTLVVAGWESIEKKY